MPKVNTILNYFTSPKSVKKPEAKKEEREKSQTPKREQKKKGLFRKLWQKYATNGMYRDKVNYSLVRGVVSQRHVYKMPN